MPPTSQSRSQRTVETRWNRICSCKDELLTHDQCAQMGIQVTRLELETTRLAHETEPITDSSSDSSPASREVLIPTAASYFEPLTDKFMLDYPVDSDRVQKISKEDPDFLVLRDYDPEAAIAEERTPGFRQKYWRPSECLLEVISVLKDHIFRVPRKSDRGYIGQSLIDIVDWINVNHEVALSQAFYLPSRNLQDSIHPVRLLFEVKDYIYPHVTMAVQHNIKETINDNLILRHELAYILQVMRTRLNENLFDKKQPQPVLILSFVAPQHGRILEAYIEDQYRVKVASSRLYSFEKNSAAPFELFYRWFLGRPIGVGRSQPRPRPDFCSLGSESEETEDA
ncbi:hypothetical protein DTO166G5_546 [Paecilomyces variotii]|nr:hypothetical protein DTO166G5_546 [Paecilomyces variotii]